MLNPVPQLWSHSSHVALWLTAKKTLVTREDRERNRQVLLGEIEAACQAEHEDRRREAQKKLDCRSDLLGQIEYNKRRKREAGQEEARLVDKQNDAEKLFQEELKYLLANPTTLKWNQRRKTLPDEHKISCSEPHWLDRPYCVM